MLHSVIDNNQVMPHFANAYTTKIELLCNLAEFYRDKIDIGYNKSVNLCLATFIQTLDL